MTRGKPTHLVVSNGEEDEAMRVLSEQRLISFFRLDRRRDWKLLLGLDDFGDGFHEFEVVDDRGDALHVLLSRSFEAEFLCWGLAHLESVNARGSLREELVSDDTMVMSCMEMGTELYLL